VILPGEHSVCEQVEPRGLLCRDELGEVALDLLVDGLLASPAAVEVTSRLHKQLGTRANPGYERLQLRHGL
jgi:hypothetical protein